MWHILMPIAVGRWPEMLFHYLTRKWRPHYPQLLFWAGGRSGTTTLANQLISIPNTPFVGMQKYILFFFCTDNTSATSHKSTLKMFGVVAIVVL